METEEKKTTPFSVIYDRFLGKITDDMYVELTPEDTLKDIQHLLLEAIPGFEFPRQNLYNYTIETIIKKEDEVTSSDFVIGIVWHEIDWHVQTLDDLLEDDEPKPEEKYVIVDNSSFGMELTSEEINILAILMMQGWVQRQVTSIENTRMKYSGSDFKMTSQANHLAKLLNLLSDCQKQSLHMQRLYKRRRIVLDDGRYRSNWDVFGRGVYYDRRHKI